MSESKSPQGTTLPLAPIAPAGHAHPNGRRCCGRPIAEKCSPDEEAAKTNEAGEKSCCKGHQTH